MSFDPNAYWIERGRTYKDETRLNSEFYREQEQFVLDVVREIQPREIFEAGCGFGRITKRLATLGLPMLATDLSPDQIKEARKQCAEFQNVELTNWDITEDWPMEFYKFLRPGSLVLAIEVLLHQPLQVVREFVLGAFASPAKLLHDFYPDVKPGSPVAEHCFAHDYHALYKEVGLQVREFHCGPHSLMLVG